MLRLKKEGETVFTELFGIGLALNFKQDSSQAQTF